MQSSNITFSSLLSLAIVLISIGLDLVKSGTTIAGSILVVSGVALIFIAVYLFEKGLIPEKYGSRKSA